MPQSKQATKHGICVLGLHHTRKGGAEDPLEALTGSNGLSAVADTTLALDHDASGITLYLRGRDIEEKETALQFVSGIWQMLGDAANIRRSDERRTILRALEESEESEEPVSPSEIAANRHERPECAVSAA